MAEKTRTTKEEMMYEVYGESLMVYLPDELDDHNCRGIREDMDNIMRMHYISEIIFDFSKTKFMDSSGIGVLLGRCRIIKERGGNVVVQGENARIRRILTISGIYRVVIQKKPGEGEVWDSRHMN